MKVEELGLSEKDEKGFLAMRVPCGTAKVALKMCCHYDSAYKKLQIWVEQGIIKKQKVGRKFMYFIDQNVVEL